MNFTFNLNNSHTNNLNYSDPAIYNSIFTNFRGVKYRTANNWFSAVNVNDYKDIPIKYLEIGAFFGANAISVAYTYGAHKNSLIYCVDPWEDYDDYPEYRGQQHIIYNSFINNVETSGKKDKMIINRGYSNEEIPKYQDNYFDIIYIDGNHQPEYVLEDAVLCFRKLKKNGILIFDDYGWCGPDLTQRGIDAFLAGYRDKIEKIDLIESQFIVKKLKD